jgi:hypothetical protein
MHVQTYLLTHTFAELAREHGVYASLSADARKASITYDQIEARESDPLASQCRGLVLAREGHAPFAIDAVVGPTRVVARPFDRFFNHGQHGADAADMLGRPGTRVCEKVDGTLCIVYFDDHQGRWHVATRSVPEADKPIGGMAGSTDKTMTFRGLFERALDESHALSFDAFTAALRPEVTYLFELATPFNLVLVHHPKCAAHFLGARLRDGTELPPDGFAHLPTPHAASHPCASMADLLALITARPPTESEGVVVVDAGFRRVKVKSPAYVALHGLKDSVANSPRRLLELILLGREDDAFPLLPTAVREHGELMRARYALTVRRIDDAYDRLIAEATGDNPRKAFALAVQRERLPIAPMMARYVGQCAGLRAWVDRKRNDDGSWPDGFLDLLMDVCEVATAADPKP